MKIKELKGLLANILEVPEDPISLGRELWKGKDFFKQNSPKMLQILSIAFALQCIWEEFEEILEAKGRNLEEEANRSDIKLLLRAINKFFSPLLARRHISRSHPNLRKEILSEKAKILEAIELLWRRI